jgi:hypothetical protein
VLEARGTANSYTYNTVAIAGLDGYARAKTTFTSMPTPDAGCIGAILPPQAHVAVGKVFFADGKGVVRSLAIDGTISVVATFPLTSTQQMLSFAVSPDGSKVLGAVYTIPKGAFSCGATPTAGTFSFDAYSAAAGGPSTLLYHLTWTKPQDVLALTGWDAVGPIGTFPTVWASQGGGPGSALGVMVRVDPVSGRPGARLADPASCLVWNSIATGAFVCTKDATIKNAGTPEQIVTVPVSVRSADGSESWAFTVAGSNGAGSPYLDPGGVRVILCCNDSASELVIGKDGSRGTLGGGLYGSGWLDSSTVVGTINTNPWTLGYVALNAPGTVVSLGFQGAYVGTVRF